MDEGHVVLVSDQNYPRFLGATASVVVFGIVPCQQCEEYDPIFRQVATQYNGSIKFGKAKMHVPGACREIKRKYKFESFPTTHFYRNGTLVHQAEGKLDLEMLTETIKTVLLTPS
jgi:thioredoxin-like negative regulator of GroEL